MPKLSAYLMGDKVRAYQRNWRPDDELLDLLDKSLINCIKTAKPSGAGHAMKKTIRRHTVAALEKKLSHKPA